MSEVSTILRNLGWRIRTSNEQVQCVKNFQRGYAIGDALTVDGVAGPKTLAALRNAESRRKRGVPTASAHFSFLEFRCKCDGRYASCARIWVRRSLIKELEQYRAALGSGVSIVSGCRCYGHNKAVGGATRSRHMAGDAADFAPLRSLAWFEARKLFNGKGYNAVPSSHPVRHGDMNGIRSWRYG